MDSFVIVGGGAAGVSAAGDVASWVNPRYQRRMRVEHRMNATEQGAAAALNLFKGHVNSYAPLPYFWTDQYNVKIQVHGYLPDGCEAIIEEGSVDDGKFVALYRADGVATAVLGWNAPARVPAYRKLLLLFGRLVGGQFLRASPGSVLKPRQPPDRLGYHLDELLLLLVDGITGGVNRLP
jgi:hypothetical protein